MKRIIVLIMIVSIFLTSVLSCKKDDKGTESSVSTETSEKTETETETEPVNDINIISNGKSDYKIIRSEKNFKEYEKDVLVTLTKYFKREFNTHISCGDDWVNESLGYREGEFEILIGETNREESKKIYSNLKYDDYAVAIVGKKIVIAAHTKANMDKALEHFMAVIKVDKNEATLKAKDVIFENYDYNFDKITLNNKPIQDYKIICSENAKESTRAACRYLQIEIVNNIGYNLDICCDSEKESEYEIVIGSTNRGDSAKKCEELSDYEYKISFQDNKIYFCAGKNPNSISDAITKFINNLHNYSLDKKVNLTKENMECSYKNTTNVDNILLNGSEISEFSIVFQQNNELSLNLANRLSKYIENLCGKTLKIYSDKEQPAGKEILIGYTNRNESGGYADKLLSEINSLKEGEYLIKSEENYIFLGGKKGSIKSTIGGVNGLINKIEGSELSGIITILCNEKSPLKVNETSYKVITYNDGGNAFTKPEQVGQILKDYAPDIIGLQEVKEDDITTYEDILEHYDTVFYRNDPNPYGAPVMYNTDKFVLVDYGIQWLSDTPDEPFSVYEDSDYVRSYIYTILKDKTTGEKLAMINTHLDYVDSANRKQMAKLLELTKDRFFGYHILYTADFNMNNTQDGYKQIRDAGFANTELYVKDAVLGGTFMGSNMAIDFCFVDITKFIGTEYKIIKDHKYSETASDHYPVYTEITLIH